MATNGLPGGSYDEEKLRFYAFQQPYVCTFVEQLQKAGIPQLLTIANQKLYRDNPSHKDISWGALLPKPGQKTNYFDLLYSPTEVVDKGYPRFNVDFDLSGAYSQYNWELFFHIPLFIATRLLQDQRHEEAMQWFHYIFNPMTDDTHPVPQRYWNVKPFRDQGVPERIQDLLWTLQDPTADKKKKEDVEAAIADWREHPFQPHRIARGRPGAYMKTVVMKYLDNLIAWGDKLFSRDTIESINEATQLYILAANLLGIRPRRVPPVVKEMGGPLTYATLRKTLDDFSNGIVQVETLIPFSFGADGNGTSGETKNILGLANLAFCIPHNDKLLSYWDTVEDRLFKIRHCMNFEGVVRELPLFEPPIDPALLVRATAMGLDLSKVLDDLAAPLPHYRFVFMLQKAREFCEELKQLGSLLLSALEKKDGEKLAQIRAGHEKALLEAVREVKRQQIKEAENTLAGLEQARAQASVREQFYSNRAFTIAGEKDQLAMLTLATALQTGGQGLQLAASFAHGWPDQFIGSLTGSMGGGAIWLNRIAGGSSSGAALQSAGRALEILGGVAQARGSVSGLLAGYRRRADDWKLQADIAGADIKQIDKQMIAADFRRQIAESELANHEKQIEQAGEIEDFLREKFTNHDLYTWMVSQVSAVYFQAYKLAYDLAKRAERTYRHELGITDSHLIQFGAWDNLRKGLLAGERLSLDLRRLEAVYLDQNKRTYELTKHVSLARLDPLALIRLRQTSECEVDIPEALFDLDYPGHYLRRIKSVSLTIPSVTGPYTSVSCTLTLLKHLLRRKCTAASVKDPLEESFSPLQSIATSAGRNDAGLFELNFHDERRLPFEGAGAVSKWRIELPTTARQFDYDTISDVILHISYTALEGGAAFKQGREAELKNTLSGTTGATGLYAAFEFRHDFPNEWNQLRQGQAVSLSLGYDRFPYFASVMNLTIEAADWLAQMETKSEPAVTLQPAGTDAPVEIIWKESMGLFASVKEPPAPAPSLPSITFGESFKLSSASGDHLTALWLLIKYRLSKK
ncbi:MAG TPA: hypothetical protein VGV87_06535 [Blastocatellia bacterium]|nr:hypothetical protein [Blastocatellia bacterium]